MLPREECQRDDRRYKRKEEQIAIAVSAPCPYKRDQKNNPEKDCNSGIDNIDH
jgi:hypothetical protein